ncbi:hypothetical protein [Methylocystis sp. ATCC 49242]|uniref:hypothetical protein n=1 Tax=Methylocystis sp. ATCC 49242 TaxID=622637 RepID=UPI0005615149|nr:hypothetical protein [Methylocystis sp. ATCC 49242]
MQRLGVDDGRQAALLTTGEGFADRAATGARVADIGDEEFPKARLGALAGGADKRGNLGVETIKPGSSAAGTELLATNAVTIRVARSCVLMPASASPCNIAAPSLFAVGVLIRVGLSGFEGVNEFSRHHSREIRDCDSGCFRSISVPRNSKRDSVAIHLVRLSERRPVSLHVARDDK